ncbi:MAG: cell wall-binding repeat-containing protein [Clostridiaceae bacterium]|nr:cell wall-binding repeat-containing protein [Clostridiaceae bacterium]
MIVNMKSKKIICMCIMAVLTANSSTNIINVSAAPVDTEKQTRISGEDRYETSIKISEKGWSEGSECVVIASGEGYADALSAAPLAKAKNAPILLTQKNTLSDKALEEIKRLNASKVIIIGGEGSVSKNVEDTIKKYTKADIERIWGQDRYKTSVKVAEKLGKVEGVVIASGENYADALSAAPAAAIKGIPVLLSEKNHLPEEVSQYINSNSISKSYIIGGNASIDESVEKLTPSPERLGGKDRYETNRKVIEKFIPHFDFNNVYLALGDGPTGSEFADALSGSAIAGKQSAPIILTNKSLESSTGALIKENIIPTSKISVLGGDSNIPNSITEGLSVDALFLDKKGETYTETINSNVDIKEDNITVKGNINGNLYIQGNNSTIANITVNGTVYVNPGDKGVCNLDTVKADKIVVLSGKSLNLKNIKSKIVNVQSRNTIDVKFENCADIEKTAILSSAIIESVSGSLNDIKVADIICNDDPVEFRGLFDKTVTLCSDSNVKIASGATIYNIIVPSNVSKRNIKIQGEGSIGNVYNSSENASLNIGEKISILGTVESLVRENITSNNKDTIKKVQQKNLDKMSPPYTSTKNPGGSSGGGSGSGSVQEITALLRDEIYLDDNVNVALGKSITQGDLKNLSITLIDSNNKAQKLSAALGDDGQSINVNAPSNGYDIGENYKIVVENTAGGNVLGSSITKSFTTLKAYTLKNKAWTFTDESVKSNDLQSIIAEVINSKGEKIPVNVSVNQANKEISVSPKDAYKENEDYTLYLKTSSGTEIKSLAFRILEDKRENKVAYTYPGIFLMGDIDEDVVVKSNDVMLIGSNINGSVVIAEEVGQGTVKLKRINAVGILNVKAGGAHSIHVIDSTFGKLIIDDAKNTVRVVAEGSTKVDSIEMKSGGILKINDGSLAAKANVSLSQNISENANVILDGNFGKITSEAANININLASGTVDNLALNSTAQVQVGSNTNVVKLDINETAGSSKVNISDNAVVTNLNVQASASIAGKGKVEGLNVNAGGTVIEKQLVSPDKINASDGIGSQDRAESIAFNDLSSANVALDQVSPKNSGETFNLNVTQGKNAVGKDLHGPVNVTVIGTDEANNNITILNNESIVFTSGSASIPVTVMGNGTYSLKVIIRGVAEGKVVSDVVVNPKNAPALVNGLSFTDAAGEANNGKTVVSLGLPSIAGNSFVYKISDNDSAISTPKVGDKLIGWQEIASGDMIAVPNGKHIGVAEINSQKRAIQFSDAAAVVGADEHGDKSTAEVKLSQVGDKILNTAFDLSVMGAKDSDGKALSGNTKVTVTANGAEVFNDSINFVNGNGKIPVTISKEGTYELKVTVNGITGTKVIPNVKVNKALLNTVIVDEGSVAGATAANTKITGLTSGKRYKVTVDGTVWYVAADGTLSINRIDSALLTGTEITGLTNGKTYKVEEYTVEATSVNLDKESVPGAKAGDGKITGLTTGKKYKVTVDGAEKYVKGDGTLTEKEDEAGELTGTEVTGLTNGKTYKVEEYTVGVKNISSIPAINDINVVNGTTIANVGLPGTISITLSDNTTVSATVTWDGGSPAYDGNKEGTYTFSGTINLPEGVSNKNNLKASVNVKVGAAAGIKNISSVASINDINVVNGTISSAIGLPGTVSITLSDNTTVSATVTWDGGSPAYDGNKEGTYTFSGTINLPNGVSNENNLKASVKVNVAAASSSAPTATKVIISGTAEVGSTLTGSYTYADGEGDKEGTSTYNWYRSDDANGKNKTAISGATGKTYKLTTEDLEKYISFEVTPVSTTGATGTAVESNRIGRVIGRVIDVVSQSKAFSPSLHIDNGIQYVSYLNPDTMSAEVVKNDGTGWKNAGDLKSAENYVRTLNSYVYEGVPYVLYGTTATNFKPLSGVVVKKYNDAQDNWESVGDTSFGDEYTNGGHLGNMSVDISVYNGTPYIFYVDKRNAATGNINQHDETLYVYKYNVDSWEKVGDLPDSFSVDNMYSNKSMYVYNGTPYIAYANASGKVLIKKYNETDCDWKVIGDLQVENSVDNRSWTSLSWISLYVDNENTYLAYREELKSGGSGKPYGVKKYDGTKWTDLGAVDSITIPSGIVGTSTDVSLYAYNGTPYVAYVDNSNGNKVMVKKYDGSKWVLVGTSAEKAADVGVSLYMDKGIPYVVYSRNGDFKPIVEKFNSN